jgi:hypothetical protein
MGFISLDFMGGCWRRRAELSFGMSKVPGCTIKKEALSTEGFSEFDSEASFLGSHPTSLFTSPYF